MPRRSATPPPSVATVENPEGSSHALSRRPLRRDPLSTQIAQDLRQDILLGRLHAGSPISQQGLCEEYAVSRMPVRDALRQLTSEGLIANNSNGRALVTPPTVADLQDSFAVEALAHARAARRACRNASGEDLDRLRTLNREMMEAAESGDFQLVAGFNWRFHREINRLSSSPKLTAILRAASAHIPREFLAAFPDRIARSSREHERIVSAMERLDLDQVEKLVQRHVTSAGQELIKHLRQTGALSETA
jgi:DNA-binding GntR family transcriptional regulator